MSINGRMLFISGASHEPSERGVKGERSPPQQLILQEVRCSRVSHKDPNKALSASSSKYIALKLCNSHVSVALICTSHTQFTALACMLSLANSFLSSLTPFITALGRYHRNIPTNDAESKK